LEKFGVAGKGKAGLADGGLVDGAGAEGAGAAPAHAVERGLKIELLGLTACGAGASPARRGKIADGHERALLGEGLALSDAGQAIREAHPGAGLRPDAVVAEDEGA